jgi:hypothetical protein
MSLITYLRFRLGWYGAEEEQDNDFLDEALAFEDSSLGRLLGLSNVHEYDEAMDLHYLYEQEKYLQEAEWAAEEVPDYDPSGGSEDGRFGGYDPDDLPGSAWDDEDCDDD